MKIKKPKLYLVEWHDAHSESGWKTDKEVDEFIKTDRCFVINVGWILNETKDEIIMACRRLKWKEDGSPEWGMMQKIPKAWIKKREIKL